MSARNLLDCSSPIIAFKRIPTDGGRSHVDPAHSKYGFRTVRRHGETVAASGNDGFLLLVVSFVPAIRIKRTNGHDISQICLSNESITALPFVCPTRSLSRTSWGRRSS